MTDEKEKKKEDQEQIDNMVDEGGPSYSEQMQDELEPIVIKPPKLSYKEHQRQLLDLNADGEFESNTGVFNDE